MSSLTRMLSILDLFSAERAVLSIDEIHTRVGGSRSTTFRYTRALCDAALLARSGAGYVVGPKVIELDYTLRQSDPLLAAAAPVMQELRRNYECDVLLVGLFGGRVMPSHHEHAKDSLLVSFVRGRPMPRFRGAASKIILAMQAPRQQKRVYEQHADEIAAAGLGSDWTAFRAGLLAIRRAGFATSFGELDEGVIGYAAPVLHGDPAAPGAIVLALRSAHYALVDKDMLARLVIDAARRISDDAARLAEPPAPALRIVA